MQQFCEPLRQIGVERIDHLTDMEDRDFQAVGISDLERTRLMRLKDKGGKVKSIMTMWKKVAVSAIIWGHFFLLFFTFCPCVAS